MNLTKSIKLFEKEYIDKVDFIMQLDDEIFVGIDKIESKLEKIDISLRSILDININNTAIPMLQKQINNLIKKLNKIQKDVPQWIKNKIDKRLASKELSV